jgi:hypothetical protein
MWWKGSIGCFQNKDFIWLNEDIMQIEQAPSRYEQALTRIAYAIRDNPDTGGGVQLRRFLWSLYNMHHLVNLWTLVSRLDQPHSQLVAEVLTAALVGNLQEAHIKRALLVSGEMDRWDREHPSNETMDRFHLAQEIIEDLVKTMPPSHAHTDLVSLLRGFADVKAGLLEAEKSARRVALTEKYDS